VAWYDTRIVEGIWEGYMFAGMDICLNRMYKIFTSWTEIDG
jgi:hypothetical protein